MTGGGGGGPWRNWAGLVSGHPAHRVSPRSEPEIQAAVRTVGEAGGGIAVAGSGHSFAPLVDPDGRTLISLDGHTGIEAHDPAAMTVTVRSGTLVRQLNSELAERGLALPNQSAIAEQTVAGLVATASHGSSLRHGSLSSHLVGARVVTAGGEVREVAGADPELDAVRTHLGCLGVLSTLTFRVVPAFFLRKRVERRSLEDILGDLPALQEHEFGGFWWFPHTAQALVWWAERAEEPASRHVPASRIRPPRALMRASMAPPAMAGRTNVLFAALAGAGGEHAARSDLALLQHLAPRQQVLEYGVPLERTAEAVRALVRLSARRRLRIAAPVEVRWTAADTAWLSPAYQRPTSYVNVAAYLNRGRRTEWEPALRAIDVLLSGYDGRSHWAKVQYRTPDRLAERYPRWSDFQSVRRSWDPDGVFCGSYLGRLFGSAAPRPSGPATKR